jgi:hypothetical protein
MGDWGLPIFALLVIAAYIFVLFYFCASHG